MPHFRYSIEIRGEIDDTNIYSLLANLNGAIEAAEIPLDGIDIDIHQFTEPVVHDPHGVLKKGDNKE